MAPTNGISKDQLREALKVVDKKTGVTYLIICNTYGTGITPLLDRDGKPVITKLDSYY